MSVLLATVLAVYSLSAATAEWRPVADEGVERFDLDVLPGEPTTLLTVREGSLWRLTGVGGSWQEVPVPPRTFEDDDETRFEVVDHSVNGVWAAPRDRSRILVSMEVTTEVYFRGELVDVMRNGRLAESRDGGETWAGFYGRTAGRLAHAPSMPGVVYASLYDPSQHATLPFAARFDPEAERPTVLEHPDSGFGVALHALAVDAADPDHLYAVSFDGTLSVSGDGGGAWSVDPLRRPVSALAAHPALPGTVLAGTPSGDVWRSRDGGQTWQPLTPPTGGEVTELAFDPVEAGRYYAVVDGAALASDDAGDTWEPLAAGLPANAVVHELVVDPADPSRLFATLEGAGVWLLDRRFPAAPCSPGPTTLCLGAGNRFEVRVLWQDFAFHAAHGRAVPLDDLADDGGAFWFFDEKNLELVVKVLDGRPVNGRHWVFYGSLTNVPFTLVVTDTTNGETVGYRNPSGRFASRGDTTAFPEDGSNLSPPAGELIAPAASATAPSPCVANGTSLCLAGGRFRAEVEWSDFTGGSGAGTAVPSTDDTGFFWFFRESNPELTVKVLDGRGQNGHWWVFYGALTNVGFRLRVTDTATGEVRRYENPSGSFASRGDTTAFAARAVP